MRKSGGVFLAIFGLAWLWMTEVAQAQIVVTKARIGCLDIQIDGNLTAIVAGACNNKASCAYNSSPILKP